MMNCKSGIWLFCLSLLQTNFAIGSNNVPVSSVSIHNFTEESHSTDEEFYCYRHPLGDFEFCQRCNSKGWNPDCKQANECKCANIRVPTKGQLKGGVKDCNDEANGWCYVTKDSGCETLPDSDGEYSPDYYHDYEEAQDQFYKSSEACTKKQDNVGNEYLLENIRIISDVLEVRNKKGEKIDDSIFFMETREECQAQCKSSKGSCGAWSYNKEDQECYLHNVNACCGQFGKREINYKFVSGYLCNVCWSTKNGTDCPCTAEERNPKEDESGHTSSSGGAVDPTYLTSAGSLSVHTINTPADPCACRRGRRRQTNKCTKRCLKPRCKDPMVNPEGTCEDTPRCRNFGKTLDDLMLPGKC